MIVKPLVLGVALIFVALSRPVHALSQDIGDASCDVISAYVATSPAYIEVFRSYVEGYLAGEKNAGKSPSANARRDAALASYEFCNSSRNTPFSAAVAASDQAMSQISRRCSAGATPARGNKDQMRNHRNGFAPSRRGV